MIVFESVQKKKCKSHLNEITASCVFLVTSPGSYTGGKASKTGNIKQHKTQEIYLQGEMNRLVIGE